MKDRRSKGDAREMQGRWQALGCFMEQLGSSLEYGWSMARVWLEYSWKARRCHGDVTEMSRRCHGDIRSWERGILRYALMIVVVMVVGVNTAWGQTDYSGTYYIASAHPDYYNSNSPTTNYYLCPTENWRWYQTTSPYYTSTSNDMPFLTTYPCRNGSNGYNAKNAVWRIIKSTTEGYYYIRRVADGKYLTYNRWILSGNKGRIRVHLESANTDGTPSDAVRTLFSIAFVAKSNWSNSSYEIASKGAEEYNESDDERVYLNISSNNQNSLSGSGNSVNGLNVGGTIGLWSAGSVSDRNSQWQFEDIMSAVPAITQQSDNTIAITYSGSETVTLYYTTDGSNPDPDNVDGANPTKTYSTPFAITESTTIKAVAVKTKDAGEALDTYSKVATLSVPVLFGDSHPYLLQSQENTNYYMIPVTDTDNAGGFTKTHTTTLGQPSMMWYFLNAGNSGGVQYYYLVNKSTGQYVYYHTSGSDFLISVNSGETFAAIVADEDKDPYRFSIDIADLGGFHLCPKNNAARCITKGTSNKHNSYIKANSSKTDALGRWTFISVLDQKMPATTPPVTVSTASAAVYYTMDNEKLTGNYMSPATYVTTAASVTDSEKWYFLNAGTDDWLTYYHIVNAVSGEYLYFNNTVNNAVSTKALSNDIAEVNKYEFVLAPSSTGAFYIIPKSQATQNTRLFTSLYYDGSNPLKTSARRFWSDDPSKPNGEDAYIKWTFTKADLDACQDPVFSESGGNIIMSCPTFGAEIHYTIDGSTPTASTPTVYTNETSLPVSSQYLVKAIAVFKNDPSDPTKDVSSSDVILFNKPDVTLSQDTYTYNKSAREPTVSKVSITISETEYEAPTTPTVSYVVDSYENNINAGTATVNLVDNIVDDNIFFSSFSKDFTITPVTLTVTANAITKGYGDPDPELTYTVTGLLEGDELTGALSREEGENRGTYNIILAPSLSNPNYTVGTFNGATFTITQKSLGDNASTPAPNITCDISETSGSYSIVVKQGGSDLTLGTDYTKDGESNGAKYYQVTVTGINNYTDGFNVKLAKIHLSKLAGSVTPGGAALFVSNSDDDNFEVPDNMTAYIVTGISGNTLVTEQLDNIPTQKPVLLVSTIDANGFLVNTTTGTAPTGTNMLREATGDDAARTFNAAEIYLLYKGEFVLNAAGIVPAGKIYLPKPSGGAPAPSRLFIEWELPTATDVPQLSTLNSQLSTGIWYTLDGRRLNGHPTKKGIYLREGKKIVVK